MPNLSFLIIFSWDYCLKGRNKTVDVCYISIMKKISSLLVSAIALTLSALPSPSNAQDRRFENRPIIVENEQALNRGGALFIVLHGGGGQAERMTRVGFGRYAQSRNYAVVYPQAESRQWRDGRLGDGREDVEYLRRLIAHFVRGRDNDVYVIGASNGGMMAYRMACEASDVIRGAVSVIGNMPQTLVSTCAPRRPIRFLAINGDADRLVPIGGGEVCAEGIPGCRGGRVASMRTSLETIGRGNQCSYLDRGHPMTFRHVGDLKASMMIATGCSKPVAGIVIHGGGHVWPPLPPGPIGGGQTTRNVDATRISINFLLDGALPALMRP
jgi:polyhydroxybutyrate depolymerase